MRMRKKVERPAAAVRQYDERLRRPEDGGRRPLPDSKTVRRRGTNRKTLGAAADQRCFPVAADERRATLIDENRWRFPSALLCVISCRSSFCPSYCRIAPISHVVFRFSRLPTLASTTSAPRTPDRSRPRRFVRRVFVAADYRHSANRLYQRRHAVRSFHALARPVAACRDAPGHSLRSARPRRIEYARRSDIGVDRRRRRRPRRASTRTRHSAMERARTFMGRRNRHARQRRGSSRCAATRAHRCRGTYELLVRATARRRARAPDGCPA